MDASTQHALVELMLLKNRQLTVGEAGRRLNRIKLNTKGVENGSTKRIFNSNGSGNISNYSYRALA